MVDSPSSTEINLQLGDILEFIAPENEKLYRQQFYIKYIDQDKIKLINLENEEEIILPIIDGKLDSSIETIELLSRDDFPGYAKQNNLEPDTWIDLYFETPNGIPFIITGKINNLEEDNITVETYPDGETIYIDFAYKGIPEDLPLEKIIIRKEPTPKGSTTKEQTIDMGQIPISPEEQDIAFPEGVPTPDIQGQLQEDLLEGNLVQLGETLDEFEIFVDVPEGEKRYSIEKQTDDLLDELLSDIPNYKRTNSVLNNIHTMIERYVQLRTLYSNFDENGNANKPDHIDNNTKPIIQSLINFEKHFEWLLPVSYNRKKLYDIDETVSAELDTFAVDILEFDKTIVAEDTEIEKYYRGGFPADENKYAYLFKNLNQYYTPFQTPINQQQSITSQKVHANILSVLDNNGDLESMVAKVPKRSFGEPTPESIIENKKFLLETYTTGLTYLKDKQLHTLTPNDTISIKSVLTLGIPSMLFSRINLPTTSILERTLLNNKDFSYWNLLTRVGEKLTIDKLKTVGPGKQSDFIEDDSGYLSDQSISDRNDRAKKTFLSKIRQYILNETFINEDTTIDQELYSEFLDKIIPSNIEVFNRFKQYISTPLSLHSVIQFLEIFNIYPKDITKDLYDKITDFVEQNIFNYKNQFSLNYKTFSRVAVKKDPVVEISAWLKILSTHKDINTIVSDAYGFNSETSASEIFNKIMKIDYGKLFTIALRRIDLDLQTTGLIDDFVTKYEQSILEKQTTENNCKIITKKYITREELDADNDKQIYYDLQFDKTNYSLLKKYKSEQESMSTEEFSEFLEKKLMSDHKLTNKDAKLEIKALLAGKRLVETGDYAILMQTGRDSELSTQYFVRQDNKWIEDTEMPTDVVIKDNKLFCNLQEQCISEKQNICNSLSSTEAQINEDTLKAIYKEFDETYGEKEDNLRERIDLLLGLSIIRIRYLKRLEKSDFFKYNKYKVLLGDSIADDETGVNLIVSPYEKLRNLILGQTDFIKKQYDIQKFVLLFTREPYESEHKYWLYCSKTNVKLMPSFISHLANVFISGGDYLYELDSIADKQGTISDDGDAYVDKYSGYFIKKIAFDTEEGFTEQGFKLKTREKLEEDLGDAVLEQIDKQEKTAVDSTETKKITNIISTITGPSGMDIDLSGEKEFIVRNVLAIYNKSVPTKRQYDAQVAKLQKEGKKVSLTYQETIDTPILILTFTFIMIAIQISIPSIQSRKTFPGCIKSFKGYPIYNDDMSPLTYIACIARKMRSGTPPWNAIKSLKEEKIADRIKKAIDTYKILKIPDVQGRIIEKQNYIKTEKEEVKIDDSLSEKFYGFFPPLVELKITALPLIAGFNELLRKNFLSGNPAQQEQILTIKSKILIFSLSIQEKIQKIIDKKTPLITNKAEVPFLQNACCDEPSTDIHKYFIDLDKSIASSNTIVNELSNLIYDINNLSRAPLLFDPRNTKFKYPEIDSQFSEDTIYKAFIVFCKSKELEFNDDIRKICSIDSGEPYVDETLEEKIARLKEEGIKYDEDLLQQLLTIVNLKNSLSLNLSLNPPNYVEILREFLETIKDNPEERTISLDFTTRFITLLDRFSIKQEKDQSDELRSFKNYLAAQNDLLNDRIKGFIKINTSIKKSQLQKVYTCLDNINVFLESGDDIYVSSKDETVLKMVYFIRNSVKNIIDVFPNIVINNIDYSSVKIPKHWKLSQRHDMDVKNIISFYYKNLKQFYGMSDLKDVLSQIQDKCKNIHYLAEITPFFASLKEGGDEIKSIFDDRLIELLYKYYILLIFDTYITLADLDVKPELPAVLSIEETGEGTSVPDEGQSEVPAKDIVDLDSDKFIEAATLAGVKQKLINSLSDYLVVIIDMICEDKEAIDYNKETIMSKILTAKEKEKDEITDYLKELTDEERAVENIFKQHKLEKWSIGLQKGLTQYVAENYDQERENAEKQLLKEREIAKESGINEFNKDIYAYEFDEQAELAERIDADVYSLEDYQGEDAEADYDNDPDDYETY